MRTLISILLVFCMSTTIWAQKSGWFKMGGDDGMDGIPNNWLVKVVYDSNDNPIFLYQDQSRLILKTYRGGWKKIGILRTKNTPYIYDMIIDNNNNPIVAYYNQSKNSIKIFKREMGKWLAFPPIKHVGYVTSLSMTIDQKGKFYVAHNGLSNHKAGVFRYDIKKRKWVKSYKLSIFPGSNAEQLKLSSTMDGDIILSGYTSMKYSKKKLYVYIYNGKKWKTLGKNPISYESVKYNISTEYNNRVVVAIEKDSDETVVKFFNGKRWKNIFTGININSLINNGLKIGKDNSIYFSFIDDYGELEVGKIKKKAFSEIGESIKWQGMTSRILFSMDSQNRIMVLYPDSGSSTFLKSKLYGIWPKVDTDADMRSELAWRKRNGSLLLWFVSEYGPYLKKSVSISTDSQVLSIADFDGDYKADYLIRMENKEVVIRFSKGSTENIGHKNDKFIDIGNFTLNAFQPSSYNIMWRKDDGNYSVDVLENGAVVDTLVVKSPGKSYKLIAWRDFNKDGIDDLLWKNGKRYILWYMYDNVIVNKVLDLGVSNNAFFMAKDINKDGCADIIWKKNNTYIVWYFDEDLMNIKRKSSLRKPSQDTILITVGYFGGDGKADYLWYDKKNKKYILQTSRPDRGVNLTIFDAPRSAHLIFPK